MCCDTSQTRGPPLIAVFGETFFHLCFALPDKHHVSVLPVIEVNLDDAFLIHCDSEKLLKDLEIVRNLSPHYFLSLRALVSSRLSGLRCFRMKEVCCLWKRKKFSYRFVTVILSWWVSLNNFQKTVKKLKKIFFNFSSSCPSEPTLRWAVIR